MNEKFKTLLVGFQAGVGEATMAIKFYRTKDPYGYMGNFYRARFFIYGRWWDTVEHPYQAQKAYRMDEYDAIHQAKTPRIARDLGQVVTMSSGWLEAWNTIHKDRVMYECVLAKFLQHKDIRDQLIATGDEELIEDSPVDWYWGCGKDGTGQNTLGKILMKVRQELRGE